MKTIGDYITFKDNNIELALTDKSFKKYTNNHSLTTNEDLATLGDAVLKLALTDMLYNRTSKLTLERETYETDKFLVRVIGRKYNMIDHIKFDEKDTAMPKNYDYNKPGNCSPHKYIATAVEALIGAIYLIKRRNMSVVKKMIKNTLDDCKYEIEIYKKIKELQKKDQINLGKE